jgi:hypothetical protein
MCWPGNGYFCDIFSYKCTAYKESNVQAILNDELGCGKEAVVTFLRYYSSMSGGVEENNEEPQNSRPLGRYSKPGPSKYKEGVQDCIFTTSVMHIQMLP